MSNEQPNAGTFVLFEVAGTTYAVRSDEVQQLEMIEHITPVPNAVEAVEGVVFSRGQVIPAINLRTRFGFPKRDFDLRSRLVIVAVEGRQIGLIADTAREFKHIPNDVIKPPSENLETTRGRYIEAIATLDERIILLLNLREVVKVGQEIEVEN